MELYIFSPYTPSWRGHGQIYLLALKYLPALGRNALSFNSFTRPCVGTSESSEYSLQPHILFDL